MDGTPVMHTGLKTFTKATAATLFALAGIANADASEPLVLSDVQLDSVTAGAVVVVEAEAFAAGTNTLATIKGNIVARDKPWVDVVRGKIKTKAKATGDGAFTDTYAAAEFGDVDIAFVKTKSKYRTNASGTVSVSKTKIKFRGYDFSHIELPAPIIIEVADDADLPGQMRQIVRQLGNLNGNIAQIDVNANAYGDNSLVDVQVQALAIENVLSQALLFGTVGTN